MPTLTVELSDEEYANALALPADERRRKISAVFATARDAPGSVKEQSLPFPYFDGDEVVTPNGRRPRRPWDGKSNWDGKSTNPDDHPDFEDMTAETSASIAVGILDLDAGRVRDGKEVMREMRTRIRNGEFSPNPAEAQVHEYRNGK